MFKTLVSLWFFTCLLVFSSLAFTKPVTTPVAEPNRQGEFDVGFTSRNVMLPGGVETTVNIWYPIAPASGSGGAVYHATTGGPGFTQTEIYIESPLRASHEAEIANGIFPLIVITHGGGPVGLPDNTLGLVHMRLAELSASHGFVTLSYTKRRYPSSPAVGLNVEAAFNVALSLFPDSVDENNIGVLGSSAGGAEVVALAAGISVGSFHRDPDDRVKAAVLLDSAPLDPASPQQIADMKVPYILFSGSLLESYLGTDNFFEETVKVSPRRHVKLERLSHFAIESSSCDIENAKRNASLQKQITDGVVALVDPLTAITPSFSLPGGDPGGISAYVLWNFTQIGGLAIGELKEFCSTVGVDNPLLSTDFNGDGINDAYTGVDALGQPVLDIDATNSILTRYIIAHWKVYLAKDVGYSRFLTPGYVQKDPRVSVTVRGGRGK
jgi:hypothetical protein